MDPSLSSRETDQLTCRGGSRSQHVISGDHFSLSEC